MRSQSWQRPTWVEVDLGAIRFNINLIRQTVGPEREIMAVVKADAYGHGAKEVAREALYAGASCLGVGLVEEGIELRREGIRAPIVILGPTFPFQARAIVEWRLSPGVWTMEMAEALQYEASERDTMAVVHVKVDTGMSRMGVSPSSALEFLEALRKFPNLHVEGIYTHLATAEEAHREFTKRQLDTFLNLEALIRERMGVGIKRHVANSSALFLLESSRFDLVRPGIAIYGCRPKAHSPTIAPLRPALSWKTRVCYLRDIRPGDAVSYGCKFVASKPTRVAILPVGYGDGIPCALSGRGEVLIRGRRAPIIGAVCMDVTMVDVTDIEDVAVEDEVVIIGPQGEERITAEEVAQWAGTISYEILCGISRRTPRIYLNGST